MNAFRLHFLTQTQTNFKCQFIREVCYYLIQPPASSGCITAGNLEIFGNYAFCHLKITIKISLNTS